MASSTTPGNENFDEYDWFYDSLIQFLQSPLWKNPIETFIDQNCITFAKLDESEGEEKLIYTEIHKQFRKLMEDMLEGYLAELGIPPEIFVESCIKGNNQQLKALVLEHILAMDDYLSFKAMMEKRNYEIEYQALEYIKKQKETLSSPSLVTTPSTPTSIEDMDEDQLLQLAISNSLLEQELSQKKQQVEEAEVHQAIAMSVVLDEFKELQGTEITAPVEQKPEEAVPKEVEKQPEPAPVPQPEVQEVKPTEPSPQPVVQQEPVKPAPEQPAVVPTKQPKASKSAASGLQSLAQKLASLPPVKVPPKIDPLKFLKPQPAVTAPKTEEKPAKAPETQQESQAEIEKRLKFLQMQKEKLLQQKQSQREEELQKYTSQQAQPSQQSAPAEPAPVKEESSESAKMRAALAKKLTQELIQQQEQQRQSAVLSKINEMNEKLKQIEELRKVKVQEEKTSTQNQKAEKIKELSKIFSNIKVSSGEEFKYAEK